MQLHIHLHDSGGEPQAIDGKVIAGAGGGLLLKLLAALPAVLQMLRDAGILKADQPAG